MSLSRCSLNFADKTENKEFSSTVHDRFHDTLAVVCQIAVFLILASIISEIIFSAGDPAKVWVINYIYLGINTVLLVALYLSRRYKKKVLYVIIMYLIGLSLNVHLLTLLFKQFIDKNGGQQKLMDEKKIEKEAIYINTCLLGAAIQLVASFLTMGLFKWYLVFVKEICILATQFAIMFIFESGGSRSEQTYQFLFFPIFCFSNTFFSYQNEKILRQGFHSSYSLNQHLDNFKRILMSIIPTGVAIFNFNSGNPEEYDSIFFNEAARSLFKTAFPLEIKEQVSKNIENIDPGTLKSIFKKITVTGSNMNQDMPDQSIISSANDSQQGEGELLSIHEQLKLKIHKYQCKNVFFSTNGCYEESENDEILLNSEPFKLWLNIKFGRIEWEGKEVIMACFENIASFKEVDEFKNKILATVSHNLKTPLNSVSTNLEFMNEYNRDYDLRPQLKAAVISNKILKSTVNDILDLAKMMQGKLELCLSTISLQRIIKEIKKLGKYQAELKFLEFRLEISPELGNSIEAELFTDPDRLFQVLNNLISNAIKFTSKGYVKISITKVKHQYKEMIKFSIEDTGVGISPENIPQLFKMQSNKKRNTNSFNIQGASFGLPISQEIAKLLYAGNLPEGKSRHGIQVESIYMKGSKFQFQIPIDPAFYYQNKEDSLKSENISSPDKTRNIKLDQHLEFPDLDLSKIMKEGEEEKNRKFNDSEENSEKISIFADEQEIAKDYQERNSNQKNNENIPQENKINDSKQSQDLELEIPNENISTQKIRIFDMKQENNLKNLAIAQMKEIPIEIPQRNEQMLDNDNFLKPVLKQKRKSNFQRTATQNSFLKNMKENLVALVVDDDAFCIDVGKKLLTKSNIAKIEFALNGQDAVEKVKNSLDNCAYFDLILMDCNMPLKDGFETTKEILELQKNKQHVWIIGITANVGTATEEQCKKCGMEYYLKKPVNFNDFQKVINEIASKSVKLKLQKLHSATYIP